MSWLLQLDKVYEHHREQVGHFEERRNQRITLLPVSHVMQSAQIEITLDHEGQFYKATVVDKEHARTIVPATLASANRSGSAVAPHFIHDKLFYVAGDYRQYGDNEKRFDNFNQYLTQMKQWVEEGDAPWKIQLIYQYIAKSTVIQDLIDEKIIKTTTDGRVIQKWLPTFEEAKPPLYAVSTGEVLETFVRFNVLATTPNDPPVWEDIHLFNAFTSYLERKMAEDPTIKNGFCYVSGQQRMLTSQHGARLRNAGDMSKLISSNDKKGFTYRGRFATPTEAVQIGYDISQKAHHALRWLIQRQGTYVDTRYFVAFGVENSEVPSLFDSTAQTFDIFAQDLEQKATQAVWTEEMVAENVIKAIHGFKHHLQQEDVRQVIVMVVDAATSGRLAIVYYQQFHSELFVDALHEWHQTCKWLQVVKQPETNKRIEFVGTPSTYKIAEAVYGAKADPKVKKELHTRLLPCIVERKPIPKDIVRTIYQRVCQPMHFKDAKESWQSVCHIACALIRKQEEKEGYTVALQEENRTRDYLFGRLLGVAEVMERSVLKERDEKRATNATRYFNAFSQHPARTWSVIRKQLQPYFVRLGVKANRYKQAIEEIESCLKPEQMTDVPLKPIFLLGYSSQIQHWFTKKSEEERKQ